MLCDKNMYAKIQQKSKERGKSMLQLERQQKILDYLKENRKATTNELSELLGVSTTTIRTDLNQMDKEKLHLIIPPPYIICVCFYLLI